MHRNSLIPDGATIRRLRKQHRMTQEDLARGICSDALISVVELKDQPISELFLKGIADKLGVSLGEIMRGRIETVMFSSQLSAIETLTLAELADRLEAVVSRLEQVLERIPD